MKGLTSKIVITAHHSTSKPVIPSAGRMRRRHMRRRRAAAHFKYSASTGVWFRRAAGVSRELAVMAMASAGFQNTTQVSREPNEFRCFPDLERPVLRQVDRHDLADATGIGGEHQHAL